MLEIIISTVVDRLVGALSSRLIDGFKYIKEMSEIHNAVEHLKENLKRIMVVLGDAEGKQSNTNVKDWLEKLKDVSYDIDDVIDEWNTRIEMMEIRDNNNNQTNKVLNLNKLLCYMCFQCDTPPRNVTSKVKLHIKFSEKVKELNGRVDAICTEKDKFSFNMSNSTAPCSQQVGEPRLMTTSFINVFEVYGRDREEQVLVDKLVGDHEGGIGSRDDKKNMTNNTLHIVGMGGIGKTTLAKLAYHALK
ncbi:putative disease resistance protein RGA1 [Cannabis sativa]|uniref:putative disease resistance protein RGA1 n=1 Tax=Cannabis sativa TaxID=3483 RepID=UPI0029C9F941|nr:putative disease resistance protein RGA1 [Cannabis sativa]